MYYNARYYDPAIGQFISPDTIVPDPSNVLDYNRYMYVRGNPLNMNDPSGHFSESAINQYVSDYCSGFSQCTNETLNEWQNNGEWWGMLLSAQAGDTLFGTYDPIGGVPSGSFYFQFLGIGTSQLNGIQLAQATSSSLPLSDTGESFNWSAVTLNNLSHGNYRYSSPNIGDYTVRLVWNGVTNGSSAPIYMRMSTARIVASSAMINQIAWANSTMTKIPASGNQRAVNAAKSMVIDVIATAICQGAAPTCSTGISGLVGFVDTKGDATWAYKVYTGPMHFEFGLQFTNTEIVGGQMQGGGFQSKWTP